MYDNSYKGFLQEHEGSLQFNRLEKALRDEGLKVSAQTFEEMVKQTAEFARSVIFYNDEGAPDGDWTDFFSKVYDYETGTVRSEMIRTMMDNRSVDPHLALLFSFFQLLLVEQGEINKLADRRTQFYFRDVLGFEPKSCEEGKATIFVDLKKDANTVSIPKGALFDAGKDGRGKRISYAATDEVCLGREEVEVLASFDNKRGFVPRKQDGASPGHAFCLASPYLNQPGVQMKIVLNNADASTLSALKVLRAEYTGSKGWAELELSKDQTAWKISKDADPIVPYDPQIHGGTLSFRDPVIRFVSQSGLDAFSRIHLNTILGIWIQVSNADNIKVANSYGELENKVGVNPFGAGCRVQDLFWVELPFPANSISLNIEFRDKLSFTSSSVYDSLGKTIRRNYVLTDKRCDQGQLSNAYSQAVLSWMSDKAASTAAIAEAMKNGLVAITPSLAKEITLTYAEYFDSNVKTCLQFPYGSYRTSGLKCPLDAVRILDGQAACYIGLTGLSGTDSQLSLYVSLSEHYAVEPGKIAWSYLSGGVWKPFGSGSLLKDSTDGLSKNGILMFALSEDFFKDNGGMLPEYRWIRAISDNTNAGLIAEVTPRAIELAYSPESEGAGPEGKALPAGTIVKPVFDLGGVKSVSQPFDGEAGRLSETDKSFECRVAEQLRHKNRAWSPWDYEHLVLERFSEVSFVKCLPTYSANKASIPGGVTLVVVPSAPRDILKPAPDNVLRNKITDYIKGLCSPFVRLEVIGPEYKEVKVTVSVHLRKGCTDTAGYATLINEALKDFLKAWDGSSGETSHFRNGAGKSEVITFLESLPYIDYIDGINLNAGDASEDEDEILASLPHELLTSAPSHDVKCSIADA